MSSESEDSYVHTPDADESDSSSAAETVDSTRTEETVEDERAPLPGPTPSGFGDRGWALVATVVLAFLVIPGIIYLRPALPGEAGLPFIVAMLILPLVPAVLLGLTAVWSMRASRRR